MKKTLKTLLLVTLVMALSLSFCLSARADFPEKPVTLVVPFAAGGNVDMCARIIADEMTNILGQQVLVEDREGGGAIIGQTYALNQAPDGYTLLVLTSSFVTNILSGDTEFGMEDATAVGMFCFDPEIIVASAASGITTLDEFLAAAKERDVTNSTPGYSTSHHIASIILARDYDLNFA